jgi:hypothetical protein
MWGLWLISPALGWSQSIVSTFPVGADITAVAISTTTNKIYVASGTAEIGVESGSVGSEVKETPDECEFSH